MPATPPNRTVQRALAAAAVLLLSSCNGSDSTAVEAEPIASITTTPTSLALTVGDTASVSVTTTPALASNRTVKWTVTPATLASITNVAPMGARVSVKALAPGTGSLDLTFTTPQQQVSATVFVIVKSAAP